MSLNLRTAIVFVSTMTLAACGGGGGGDDDDDDDDDIVTEDCGDSEVQDGEECDDGGREPGDGCDEDCRFEPTAYRIDSLSIRDPHLFAFEGAFDVTDTVNGDIADGIGFDGDDPPDGQLDLSVLLNFRPVDAAASTTEVDAVISAACVTPAASTTCTDDEGTSIVDSNATNGDGGCLAPVADTTGDYEPAITTPSGRCFASDQEAVSIVAGGVVLALDQAQLAATYGTETTLTNGLFMGFMSQAAADETTIPEDTPVVGGMPLSSLLLDEDKDTSNGVEGWWFYFNYTASVVPYTAAE